MRSGAAMVGTDAIMFGERLGLALLLGSLLGLDRELLNKPAGLRSYMIVSLAAASFTLVTFEIVGQASRFGDEIRMDPLRLLEAVVAGVAFLGAGAIIQSRGNVMGITTGAGLWLAGSIGVACGLGYVVLPVMTTVFGITVLFVLGKIEAHFIDPKTGDDTSPENASGKAGDRE